MRRRPTDPLPMHLGVRRRIPARWEAISIATPRGSTQRLVKDRRLFSPYGVNLVLDNFDGILH